MPYIDLRITLEETETIPCATINGVVCDEPEPQNCALVLAIHQYLERVNKENQEKAKCPNVQEIPKYIWNIEKYNKFGEITKTHYHLNWELMETGIRIKKDTIQKVLNRRFHLKGNKQYCLRVHDSLDEDGHVRWWRYVCKQNKPTAYRGFSSDDINNMYAMANDEYEQRKKENLKSRDKLLDKNNFRNKLIKHLTKKHEIVNYTEDIDIFVDICEFYQKAHQTAPFRKLDDLVIDMKVQLKILTFRQYYIMNH